MIMRVGDAARIARRTMPMTVPPTKAQSTGVMPMNSDSARADISRVSMSRPSSSVPRGGLGADGLAGA
jgi:hypothetical protein